MKKITIVFLFLVSFLSYGQPGNLCSDPIVLGSLPYTTTANTSSFADVNYEGSPGATGCGSTAPYLNGNDVVYSYTATFDGSIKLDLDTTSSWSGLFVYDDCANIGVNCVGGGVNAAVGGVTINEFAVVNGVTYFFVLSTYAAPQTMPYTLVVSENTCSNPVATFTLVPDCANGPQFLVDVNLTSLGSAFSVTLSDGTTSQVVSALGTVQVGPYPNGTPVTFTLTNDQDSSCVLTSSALNLPVCPPVNDLCSGAIDLGALTSPISSTTIGAINDNTPTCDDTGNRPDIYYSVVVPNGSTLKIGQTVNDYDSAVSVFYGDCTNRTVITCFEDPDYTQVEWANTTGADQTVYWVQDGYGTFSPGGTFTLTWSVLACANPIATFSIVSDCAVAPQFYINANVTNLGSATSLTLSDGTTSLQVTSTGSVQVGPYPNGTPKTITLTNNQDATCLITSLPLNQVVCPGPNDECINAISLTVNPSLTCTSVTAGTVAGATASSTSATECFGTEDDDVWFKFVATQTSHTISLLNLAGSTTDMYHSLWTGSDCASLTLVPGTCSDANTSTPSGLTAGTTYYLRVYTWTATVNQNSTFNVCIGTLPPPPSNDSCSTPIALAVAGNYAAGMVSSYNVNASLSPELPFPTSSAAPLNCGGFDFATTAKDIWYTVTVPASGSFTIETRNGVGITDTALQLYSGTCGAFTALDCDDDDGIDNFSLLPVTGRTAGEVLYLRVFGYNGTSGGFELSAFDASLSSSSFDASTFTAYPNPVIDKLNLTYSKNIDKVQVINLLGQEVFTRSINATNTELDLSNLTSGTYLVKVSSDNQVKTIKVVKQ